MDTNGEQPLTGMIGNVTREEKGVVTTVEDSLHGLQDGDYVIFVEIQGMTELNDQVPRKVTVISTNICSAIRFLSTHSVIDPMSFSIGDTSQFGSYVRNGIFTQVKMPKTFAFKSLRESLTEPTIESWDMAKFDRPLQFHIAFQALAEYRATKKQLPRPHNDSDATEYIKLTLAMNSKTKAPVELSNELLQSIAHGSRGDVPAICAVLGGIVAQEVLKAASGKFQPLFQYLYIDSFESLPENSELSEKMCQPVC